METQNKKTDESVKAGMEIEAGRRSDTESIAQTDKSGDEKDTDDEVHMPKNEIADDSIEQDLDEVVHEQTGGITTAGDVANKEIDGDDAVHGR